MTPTFAIAAAARFEREFQKLARRHEELLDVYERAVSILRTDPYNRSRSHPIKKLTDVSPGDGQYRIRLGRWRLRYDIEGQTVRLKYCGLRREDTY